MSPPENANSNVADTDTNGGRSPTDSDVQSASGNRPLSPEFFDLISEADPHAAKDKFYTASPAFTDLHSNIKGGLMRGVLLWSAALTVVAAVVVIYLSMT